MKQPLDVKMEKSKFCNTFNISPFKENKCVIDFFNNDPVEENKKLISSIAIPLSCAESLYFSLGNVLSKEKLPLHLMTICPQCGNLYQEISKEAVNDLNRKCPECVNKR